MEKQEFEKLSKDLFSLLGNLLQRFADVHNEFRNGDCKIETEYHANKDYWTINCCFKYCNSKYEDCVVFYLNEDFNSDEVIQDFDKIYIKAKLLLKS